MYSYISPSLLPGYQWSPFIALILPDFGNTVTSEVLKLISPGWEKGATTPETKCKETDLFLKYKQTASPLGVSHSNLNM